MSVLRVVNSGNSIALLDPIRGSRLRVVVSATEPEEEDVMLSATVTLTDAQIKALPTTPVEIIAAPGASKIILPMFAVLHTHTAVDYTNISASSSIQLPNGGYNLLLPANEDPDGLVTGILANGANGSVVFSVSSVSLASPLSFPALVMTVGFNDSIANQPLNIQASNTGDFTGGNAANTMKITVFYALVDL